MKHQDIRKAFNGYFESHGHKQVESSSLIPHNDPTLLFTNAGMNQFKNVFLGSESLAFNRAVTIQKCVRAGGKHNDLENVGYTTRHHTFFEMLGNFSFGDYFKKDAIHFAWDLLTKKMGIPKEKLYVTVFETDDEAADIWHNQEGVPRDRIHRLGEKDNFWRMGDTGPCGPCSEIFYDHGPKAALNPNAPFGQDDNRYVEIWNLVFMQFFEDGTGLKPLPKPSVDTGAGLERIAAAMQGVTDNYETDLFTPLIKKACEISGNKFSDWQSSPELKATYKVIADHARSASFLMADGIFPSNEGRGYVLRRIMRRAIRYAQKLSTNPRLFREICEVVTHEMAPYYPALQTQRAPILAAVDAETQKFLSTLNQGTQILEEYLHQLKAKGQNTIDGKMAFKLYDTFGFPLDLTQVMAREKNFQVAVKDFESEFEKARQKAKQARKSHALTANDQHLLEWTQNLSKSQTAQQFVGYTKLTSSQQKPLGLSDGTKTVTELKEGLSGIAVFLETPFYAEGGGQAGDQGEITDGNNVIEVYDCTKMNELHLHHVTVKSGIFKIDGTFNLNVQTSARRDTARNHSATHLLHAALKKVLSDKVGQAGSQVGPDKLRFDFNHNAAVTTAQLNEIEELVNEQVYFSVPVQAEVQSYKDAVKQGAVAMFGEKYGDSVRVLTMGDFSKELCGGTHVQNTSEIGLFKIVSESSVSAGVRRIEALTGRGALAFLNKNTNENLRSRRELSLSTAWDSYMENDGSQIGDWIQQSKEQISQLKKQIQGLHVQTLNYKSDVEAALKIGVYQLVVKNIETDDRNLLGQIVDRYKDMGKNVAVVLVGASAENGPLPCLISRPKDLNAVDCKHIFEVLKTKFGGKGGGRPDHVQGSFDSFDEAQAKELLKEKLK
ncbi:alanine--tRNA ligase [bacterium]|nr:alanine--tRNA ligase [bacterium]